MVDFLTKTETEIGDDAVNVVVAQTRATDKARVAVLSALCRGVLGPELAQAQATGLALAEGFYFHTASGTALDRRLADFGLARREAVAAYAPITFKRKEGVTGDIVVPGGTRVGGRDADGTLLIFSTHDDFTIVADNNEDDIACDAAATGAAYNLGDGVVNELVDAIPGLPPDGLDPALPGVTIANKNTITSGRDRDDDAAAQGIFFAWLSARSSATVDGLKVGALTTAVVGPDGVARYPVQSAAVLEHLDAPGAGGIAVTLYAIGQNGAFLTADEKTLILRRINGYVDAHGKDIPGWRAAGILVEIQDPVLVEVDIAIDLRLSEVGGPVTRTRLIADITAKVAALPIGQPLTLQSIFASVNALGDQVANCNITAPAGDTAIGIGEKAHLHSLTVLSA